MSATRVVVFVVWFNFSVELLVAPLEADVVAVEVADAVEFPFPLAERSPEGFVGEPWLGDEAGESGPLKRSLSKMVGRFALEVRAGT